MSAEQDQMIAAAEGIETALQALATHVTDYDTILHAASRAAYGEGNRQFTLEHTVGVLPELIVQRMRGLGLDAVLDRARTGGTFSESWVSVLRARIRAHVPERT
jgi:hypothetical protein